jgi:hypothetical protein
MTERSCPKCGSRMEPGHLYDDDGSIVQSSWSKKPQRKGLLVYLGLRGQSPDGSPVDVYRCGSCGYLESYASRA